MKVLCLPNQTKQAAIIQQVNSYFGIRILNFLCYVPMNTDTLDYVHLHSNRDRIDADAFRAQNIYEHSFFRENAL